MGPASLGRSALWLRCADAETIYMFAYAEEPKPSRWSVTEVRGLWNALAAATRPTGPAFELLDVTLDNAPELDEQDLLVRERLATLRLQPSYASVDDVDYDGRLAPVVDLRSYRQGRSD